MDTGCQGTNCQRGRNTQVGDSGLRLDLGVCGILQPKVEALFDFKVIDTDAPSYSLRQNQFLNRELRTKRMYNKS